MSTRWEVERAVAGSDLAPAARLILHALVSLAETKTCAVPAAHTPSLTRLEQMTGLSRSSVARHLNRLETGGWVVRKRPTPALRAAQKRTRYRMKIPDTSATETLAVSATKAPKGSVTGQPASVTVGLDLVSLRHKPSVTVGPQVLDLDLKEPSVSGVVELVTHATGASREEAAAMIKHIQEQRSPRNLAGFLRRMAEDGDLAEHLAERRAADRRADTEAAWAAINAGPECEHRMPGGAMPHPTSGEPVCVVCRAAQRCRASTNGRNRP